MDCTNYTTERRKGQHLTFEERVIIQTRWNDGWNNNQIAKEIGCTYNCIKKEADALMETVKAVFEPYISRIDQIFKTITADNDCEFTRLSELKSENCGVYFTHPYSSFEKGTNECHNRMLRRFIPKGKSISNYSQDDIDYFADIINGLPRKILGYKTPDELFNRELDQIYSNDGAA